MNNILVIGAGKSATVLIEYLIANAPAENWHVIIADANLGLASTKIGNSPRATAISFDILNEVQRARWIQSASIVISMLPSSLHIAVAMDCLRLKKHLLTASYIDDEISQLSNEIRENDLLFLYEMGLDPGIDHLSAMQLFDRIRNEGGSITSFKSHCGGLVAPESDNNPWHYKISWNPRNVVMAGKSGAHYREENTEVYKTYPNLFHSSEQIIVPGIGKLGWYANRDSLPYATLYQLENCHTLIRTTLRNPEFMTGWAQLVDLGFTDEQTRYVTYEETLHEVFCKVLKTTQKGKLILEQHFHKNKSSELEPELFLRQLNFLGLDDYRTKITEETSTAAEILQFALERKLALRPADKDMIVMLHEINYTINSQERKLKSYLVVKGDNSERTAMAKTVGLPLGIAAKLILQGKISLRGLHIPLAKEIYEPVLYELEKFDIHFQEKEETL